MEGPARYRLKYTRSRRRKCTRPRGRCGERTRAEVCADCEQGATTGARLSGDMWRESRPLPGHMQKLEENTQSMHAGQPEYKYHSEAHTEFVYNHGLCVIGGERAAAKRLQVTVSERMNPDVPKGCTPAP
jgi:hypothetical protein